MLLHGTFSRWCSDLEMKSSLVCHYYRDGPASFSEFYPYVYTRWDLHWWWSRYSLRNLWCPDPLNNCFNTNYLHVLFPKDTGIVVSYPGRTGDSVWEHSWLDHGLAPASEKGSTVPTNDLWVTWHDVRTSGNRMFCIRERRLDLEDLLKRFKGETHKW